MTDRTAASGTNARPLNDTIAGTGPGIPDEARAPGEEIPPIPSDEDVAEAAKKLGVRLEPPANP